MCPTSFLVKAEYLPCVWMDHLCVSLPPLRDIWALSTLGLLRIMLSIQGQVFVWACFQSPLPACLVTWLFSSSLDAPCQGPSWKCCLCPLHQSLDPLLSHTLSAGSWKLATPTGYPPPPQSRTATGYRAPPYACPQAPKVNCCQVRPITLFLLSILSP